MSETDKVKDFLLKNFPKYCKAYDDKSFSDLVIEVLMHLDASIGSYEHSYLSEKEENTYLRAQLQKRGIIQK